jgi:amidophosphoribosyltransferase
MIGHGDSFIIRDRNGIRPAYYYVDDEVVVAASERPAIQTAFDVPYRDVRELQHGHALIIRKNGEVMEVPYTEPGERRACSFERIYFSRGTDRDIYLERKKLGRLLAPEVLESISYDLKNTIFSFVPNTAEVAFQGLVDAVHEDQHNRLRKALLAHEGPLSDEKVDKLMPVPLRIEKLAVKDEKLRTFIADAVARNEMVSHVYDVTYGIVKNNVDTIVLLDDSIVRGTTLHDSILRIVSRLHPKRIIIVSSAPQIRYPDCYGIDMSRMKDFVAFRALVELLQEHGKEELMFETYDRCKVVNTLPAEEITNEVKVLYEQFTYDQVTERIAKIVTPPDIPCQVDLIYQKLENLHVACPHHLGDWYFSGNYPTPGGNKVANRAFINYMEKLDVRAYA